ncbi:MAG: hypothetical protein QF415_04655 [Candidatus Undinarchaeales archaeon]|nr:hypothetical protein [Candidatus Undinarchaeales archaeon]MDP7493081.1 hypothetical protein [Candidatus Undinarchaeales archaeon]
MGDAQCSSYYASYAQEYLQMGYPPEQVKELFLEMGYDEATAEALVRGEEPPAPVSEGRSWGAVVGLLAVVVLAAGLAVMLHQGLLERITAGSGAVPGPIVRTERQTVPGAQAAPHLTTPASPTPPPRAVDLDLECSAIGRWRQTGCASANGAERPCAVALEDYARTVTVGDDGTAVLGCEGRGPYCAPGEGTSATIEEGSRICMEGAGDTKLCYPLAFVDCDMMVYCLSPVGRTQTAGVDVPCEALAREVG